MTKTDAYVKNNELAAVLNQHLKGKLTITRAKSFVRVVCPPVQGVMASIALDAEYIVRKFYKCVTQNKKSRRLKVGFSGLH